MGLLRDSRKVGELKRLWIINRRPVALQALGLAMVVLSVPMMWKSLMVATKSESPAVVMSR
ncbi:unnamed protein product [Sphacelaria rigidula]